MSMAISTATCLERSLEQCLRLSAVCMGLPAEQPVVCMLGQWRLIDLLTLRCRLREGLDLSRGFAGAGICTATIAGSTWCSGSLS